MLCVPPLVRSLTDVRSLPGGPPPGLPSRMRKAIKAGGIIFRALGGFSGSPFGGTPRPPWRGCLTPSLRSRAAFGEALRA